MTIGPQLNKLPHICRQSLFARLLILAVIAVPLLTAQRRPRAAPAVAAPIDDRIAAIEQRLKQSPGDTAARDELAGAYLQKMRETADGAYLERASQLVSGILKTDPSHFEARRRQIEIEMQRHRFRRVVELARELAKVHPTDSTVQGLLGDALMELGEYDAAAEAYQKMADLKPNLASYNRVAFYRFITGDAEGAFQVMRQAIRAGAPSPENVAWCLADLGRMLFKTGALDGAEQAFREALLLFPGYHHALAGLGQAQAARARFQDAIESLLQARKNAPFPEYAAMLAKLYRKTGKEDLAARQIAALDLADKLDRAAGETANRSLAMAFADLNHRPARALELARAELEVRGDVYTYDVLAWALFRNGKMEEAAAAIEKALSQNTPEPSFHYHAAQIFDALGRAEDGRRQRARVAALNANFDVAAAPN